MKTKDKIEELIFENLDALNDNEPLDGHLERFQKKLGNLEKKSKFRFGMIWKVAAAVIFVLMAINQISIYTSPNKSPLFGFTSAKEITLASLSPEYKEVELYYTNSINTGIAQWNSFSKEGFVSEEEQKVMNEELKEFEQVYKNLQTDMKANPTDERVINAMLEYYQTKLSIINMIVNKLQEIKNQKNKDENKI